MSVLTFFARRFVAGETAESAISAGLRLKQRGIRATFDHLGEDVHDETAARRYAEADASLLRLIPSEIERNISIKLTSLGLDLSQELCLELTSGILDAALEVGGTVRIDMEGSKHTQRTLDVFHALRRRYGNVGIVLQAYLHRTAADVEEAIARGDSVRLCKGAYKEPSAIALARMDEIREAFKRYARLLLERGHQPALATHDETLIRDASEFVAEAKVPRERYQFEMLFGLRKRRWDQLVREGHDVRVYVPYGTHWLPYFTRRLRERKENVLFVLRNVLGG
jgi:proline dehydrogenase